MYVFASCLQTCHFCPLGATFPERPPGMQSSSRHALPHLVRSVATLPTCAVTCAVAVCRWRGFQPCPVLQAPCPCWQCKRRPPKVHQPPTSSSHRQQLWQPGEDAGCSDGSSNQGLWIRLGMGVLHRCACIGSACACASVQQACPSGFGPTPSPQSKPTAVGCKMAADRVIP